MSREKQVFYGFTNTKSFALVSGFLCIDTIYEAAEYFRLDKA